MWYYFVILSMLLTYKFIISSNTKTQHVHTQSWSLIIFITMYIFIYFKSKLYSLALSLLFLESSCKHKHRVSLIYIWFLLMTPRKSLISIGNKWIFTDFSDELTFTASIWQGFVIRVFRRIRKASKKPWSFSYINDRIRGFYVF